MRKYFLILATAGTLAFVSCNGDTQNNRVNTEESDDTDVENNDQSDFGGLGTDDSPDTTSSSDAVDTLDINQPTYVPRGQAQPQTDSVRRLDD